MQDYEKMSSIHAEAVIESNPHAVNAKGLIATAYVAGYCDGARGENISDGLTFGQAIEKLKQGRKVARRGWNGKGMFLWLKPAGVIKAEWCKDPMLKAIVEKNGGEIAALGTICMFTAQKEIISGWVASQADILSEDWVEVTGYWLTHE